MNQKASYEITITEKLRQLQAPDMRDAIWGRIQEQLDNDMPDDDNPDTPDTPDKGGWRSMAWKVGPFAVIVAIITIFFINKSNRSTQSNKTQKQPVNTETVTPVNTTSGSPPSSGNKTNGRSSIENKTANTPVQGSDSLFDQPLINAPLPDTSNKPILTNPAVQQSSQSPPVKQETIPKRSRGVKGISDKDYHITLKKDSVQ
jgi:hypothetical protein